MSEVCYRCKLRPPVEGTKRCLRCQEWRRSYDKKKHDERVNAGLCPCGASKGDNNYNCNKCTDRKTKARKNKAVRCTESGLCSYCEKNGTKNKCGWCSECLARRRQWRKERISQGYCSTCALTKVAVGHSLCEKCIEKKAKKFYKLKDELFSHYGGYECDWCGNKDKTVLELDHVNDDGQEHRKALGGKWGTAMYKDVKDRGFPKDLLQTLCRNCNWKKYKMRLKHYSKAVFDISEKDKMAKLVNQIPLIY